MISRQSNYAKFLSNSQKQSKPVESLSKFQSSPSLASPVILELYIR